MTEVTCAKKPCGSCPYRKDVPSGIWTEEEYVKLPQYDGEIIDQLLAGAGGLFMCHQRDGNLCAGWLQTHGPGNLLAMRLAYSKGEIGPELADYATDVPCWASGQEAHDHGMRDIANPGPAAVRMMHGLMRKRGDGMD